MPEEPINLANCGRECEFQHFTLPDECHLLRFKRSNKEVMVTQSEIDDMAYVLFRESENKAPTRYEVKREEALIHVKQLIRCFDPLDLTPYQRAIWMQSVNALDRCDQDADGPTFNNLADLAPPMGNMMVDLDQPVGTMEREASAKCVEKSLKRSVGRNETLYGLAMDCKGSMGSTACLMKLIERNNGFDNPVYFAELGAIVDSVYRLN